MKTIAMMAIGNELLEGVTEETNSKFLALISRDYGFSLSTVITTGDNENSIKDGLDFLFSRKDDLIILSGGLGATDDDITRDSIAKWAGKELVFDEECWANLVERFQKRGMRVPERNKKQAMIPLGFKKIPNPAGTACGFEGEIKGKILAVLPGVPDEFKAMLPLVLERYGRKEKLEIRMINLYGISESALNDLISPIISSYSEVSFAFLPHFPEIALKLKGDHIPEQLIDTLKLRIGKYVYSWEGESLPVVFGKTLKKHNLYFAVAESCTGGLVSKTITDIPGSSNYFDRGFVTYTNQAKIDL